jgi:hypothetical protein
MAIIAAIASIFVKPLASLAGLLFDEPREAFAHKREKDMQKHEAELEVYKKTEVERILAEIDEAKKDRDLERMKVFSEAVMKYKNEYAKLNMEMISAISNMQLDLRERTQEYVHSQTLKYIELQNTVLNQATNDFKKIENMFKKNDRAKDVLERSVEKRLVGLLETTETFIRDLSSDVIRLNKCSDEFIFNGSKTIDEVLRGRISTIQYNDVKQIDGPK